jgi:alkylated DNA repair dioxygenase AlkB
MGWTQAGPMYEQMNLWNRPDIGEPTDALQKEVVLSVDGEVICYPHFFHPNESDRFFSALCTEIQWRQETIQIFGKPTPLPRLTAWYGDEGKSYTYSGIEQHPEPWTPALGIIKARIEQVAEVQFNSVLLNFYRNGKDSVSWHSDDEPELGRNPIIGSVSFGGTRRFCFKHKRNKEHKAEIALAHGSFLLMRGETQHHWLHQIPKTSKFVAPRINLTFRVICS